MARGRQEQLSNTSNSGDIGDLTLAAELRRQAAWKLSMSERLAQVHRLNKQMSAVKGAAHGYPRATADLDLVPDPDPENLDRLVSALDSLDATLPTVGGRPFDPAGDAAVVRRGGNVTADTRFGGLDVIQLANGVSDQADLENLPDP